MARTITGVVTSDKADKTIVITAQTRKTHPIYKKQYTVTTKFIAHDEKNEAKEGDKVVIVETRPISRRKRFTLQTVVETARIQHKEAESSELIAQSKKASKSSTAKDSEQTAADAAPTEVK